MVPSPDPNGRLRDELDVETVKSGRRPFTLVCTKNQRSYDRRAAQRRDDLATLAELGLP